MPSSPPMTSGYSPTFDRALMIAALVHAKQKRKGTEVPYLTHPVHVAMVLARHGFREPLLVAALLHDVVEDMHPDDPELRRALGETFPAAFSEAPEDPGAFAAAVRRFLEAEFGPEVVNLVLMVTDEKHRADGTRIPWLEAKALAHARLARPEVPDDALALKAADSLHNVRQIVNDLGGQGLATMRRFNAPPEGTLRHYATVGRIVSQRFGPGHQGHALALELGAAVQDLARSLEGQFDAAQERVRQVMREVAFPESR